MPLHQLLDFTPFLRPKLFRMDAANLRFERVDQLNRFAEFLAVHNVVPAALGESGGSHGSKFDFLDSLLLRFDLRDYTSVQADNGIVGELADRFAFSVVLPGELVFQTDFDRRRPMSFGTAVAILLAWRVVTVVPRERFSAEVGRFLRKDPATFLDLVVEFEFPAGLARSTGNVGVECLKFHPADQFPVSASSGDFPANAAAS